MNEKIVIVTVDGACPGNGQTNARAAAAAILNYRGHRRAVAEYIGQSTNQKAEITAAALGLESLTQPCKVTLRSDSLYVVQTMTGNFRRKTNLDLWTRLDNAAKLHEVTYEWIKGHIGNPEQEAADTIARAVARLGRVDPIVLTETIQRLDNNITPGLRNAVAQGLKYLATECDGAFRKDGVGFSKFDADFGHHLAAKSSLTPRELAAARSLLRRYASQLNEHDPTIVAIVSPQNRAARSRPAIATN
jgi:ribonuclease HI